MAAESLKNHTPSVCPEHSGFSTAVETFKNLHAETKKTQETLDEDLKELAGNVNNIQGRLQVSTYVFGSLLMILCSISTYSFFQLSEFKKEHYAEIKSITAYNSEIQKSIAVIEQKLISLNEKIDRMHTSYSSQPNPPSYQQPQSNNKTGR